MKKILMTKRRFLKSALAGGTAIAGFPTIVPSSVFGADGKVAPSNRVTMGFIGTGNQGTNDLRGFLGDERVQVVAICDVNQESAGYWNGAVAGREPARRMVEEHYAKKQPSGTYKGCSTYVDFRELLNRRDIDAVEVATPDHWHCIPVIAAARAKKDIYCQKPFSLTVPEGRAMCNAIQEAERICQVGSQQRSDAKFRHACELVRNGRLGKIHTIKVGLPGGRPDYGKTGNRKKPEAVPEGFNYDMWLGPAAEKPYAPARCHVNFRWIFDYSGGQVTDWGGHHPDIAQWAMNADFTGPLAIRNPKGVYPADELWNTATEFYFEAHYPTGVKMLVSDKFKGGVTFEGSEGSIWVTRGAFEAKPEKLWDSVIGPNEKKFYVSNDHYRNFIDCVISRQQPVAPAEAGHRSITIAHLGNIAMKLGRDILWNPQAEAIIKDPEASTMLSRKYRDAWAKYDPALIRPQ